MSDSNTQLQVIVHGNHEITIKDERGLPRTCVDCRFSGWLTQHEFDEHESPWTCLLHSGGADPQDGDRILNDHIDNEWNHNDAAKKCRKRYPLCFKKNHDGKCEDFVRARPMPWYARFFYRDYFRRQMRK